MDQQTHHSPALRILLVLVLSVGSLVLGYLGGLLASSGEPLDIDDISQNRPIIFDARRAQDTQTPSPQQANDIRSSIISLYRASSKDVSANPIDRIPARDRFVGYGIVLTVDGWLAVHGRFEKNNPKDFIGVTQGNTAFAVTNIISDPALPLSYLKIQGRGLKPVQFAALSVEEFESAILASPQYAESLIVSPLSFPLASNQKETVHSSDLLEKRLSPSVRFSHSGLPVMNSRGELIGVTDALGIIPSQYVSNAFSGILKSGKTERPKGGITYNDLSQVFQFGASGEQILQGALVVSSSASGLLPGDRILKVNDEQVDQNRSLSELVSEYKVGDSLSLTVLRRGKTLTQNVTLQ